MFDFGSKVKVEDSDDILPMFRNKEGVVENIEGKTYTVAFPGGAWGMFEEGYLTALKKKGTK